MLKRSDIEKTQLVHQQLYKRQLKNIDGFSSEKSLLSYCFEIKEIFIKQEEDTSVIQQLQNSAKSLAKALYNIRGRTIFTIIGKGKGQISLTVANTHSDDQVGSLKSALLGSVDLEKQVIQHNDWSRYAAITYTPALDDDKEQNYISVLDGFLKANSNNPFEIKFVIQRTNTDEILLRLSSMYEEAYPLQKVQKSNSNSESTQVQEGENKANTESAILFSRNNSTNKSTTESKDNSSDESIEYASYAVEKYCENLQFLIDRQLLASAIGQFQVAIYIGANDDTVLTNLQNSIQQSSFEKKYGEPAKLQTHPDMQAYFEQASFPSDQNELSVFLGFSSPLTNVLTSEELARLIQLPSDSYDGFEVKQQNDFEVSKLQYETTDAHWPMGKQFVRNVLSNTDVIYPYKNLRQHCLISGITGSGKTNTVMSLLKHSPVPFLIIEPTKQEYRHLLSGDDEIKLYTPGNERLSPIRLNPFYFPVGISVMSHIDSLKAVFMSAFSMYASMPNILEQCLYSIYQKVGWDLNASINVFAIEELTNEHFPTLTHLYEEINEYLNNSGYAEEQKSNIRAALLTRIKSLMTGSKGKLLNTKETIDFSKLLQSKTIIELEEIADEDDKALIMGLFFIRLSEQFKIEANSVIDADLKHFTIIEEAHRLFKNHSESQNPEIANTKGKAVEFFCNILSEIRSKGEGIIIVDQVPTKLAPDALKNTDSKIIHRLVSQDDAEYVAQALAISKEEDLLFLSKLKRGESLFFTSGMYKAGHVLINPVKENLSYVSFDQLRASVSTYNTFVQNEERIHPIAEYLLYQNSSLVEYMLRQFRKLYHNALYGDTNRLNYVISAFTNDLLRYAVKFGYIIPRQQENEFLVTLSKGLLDKYLQEKVFFSNFNNVKDEVKYYFETLLSNLDYCWSPKELEVFNRQRELRIYPLLVVGVENILFNEPRFKWMETTRKVMDGEVIYLSKFMELSGLLDSIKTNTEAIENAKNMYDKAKDILVNEFIEWHWNKQTKTLLLRTLAHIFGNTQKPLLQQIEIWIERDSAEWKSSQLSLQY
ncbi:DUF87 domain-containing protein [Cytobacillus sp. S13-E01]|uniref:ATP-binding protein n=1 Tax=Cytobacillus sp. S13-E01 TaxID=3031326 RepID=UPI0023D817B9|nr:DUF87 domain-containing protein [Cytobacillus sp. S13-E01]MDF0728886.1 DUF87 domain-containing protein [Cytobacillus sp. S13-E01]